MSIDKICDFVIKRGFALLFFLVPLVFVATTSELFEFNKMMLTYAFAIVIVCAWAVKMVLANKFIYKRTFLEIPLLLYLASHLLSTIFSIDPHISIWGYYSRFHEGFLASLSYILLYFAAVSNLKKEDVLRIISYSFASGVIVSIWGALEHFGHSPSCLLVTGKFNVDCWIQDVKSRVFATLGQPNWMAAYLDVLILTALGVLLTIKENRKKITLGFLAALFFSALLFTKSRSGILGLGVGLGIFSIFSFKKNLKSLLVLFVSFSLLALLFGLPFAKTEKYSLENLLNAKPQVQTASQSAALANLNISASEDIRRPVWEGAIKVWQRYPVFGSGVETFAYSFYLDRPASKNLDSEWDFLYNKAHNEYLNLLATTGTLGILSYLSILGFFVVWFIKYVKQFSNLTIGLFAAWISILVTNFFGFSIVIIGLFFFLIPAFCEILTNEKTPDIGSSKTTNSKLLVIGFIGFIGIIGLSNVHSRWKADKDFNMGKSLDSSQQVLGANTYLAKAVEAVPDEPIFRTELAYNQAVLASAIFTQIKSSTASAIVNMTETEKMTTKIPQIGLSVNDLRDQSIENSNKVVSVSPNSLPFWKDRLKTFFQLTTIDGKYNTEVLDAINRAVVLAPTDAKSHYLKGYILEQTGQLNEAIEILKETLNMKPDYADAKNLLDKIKQ